MAETRIAQVFIRLNGISRDVLENLETLLGVNPDTLKITQHSINDH